jgi:hypothetical protein
MAMCHNERAADSLKQARTDNPGPFLLRTFLPEWPAAKNTASGVISEAAGFWLMLLSAGDHGDGGDGGAHRTSRPGWSRHSRARRSSRTDDSDGHNVPVYRCADGGATNPGEDPIGSFYGNRGLW